MKLQNFRRFDEMFKGKGLRQGGGLERDVWDRYQNLKKLNEFKLFFKVFYWRTSTK